jgi:hypothetical protein
VPHRTIDSGETDRGPNGYRFWILIEIKGECGGGEWYKLGFKMGIANKITWIIAIMILLII